MNGSVFRNVAPLEYGLVVPDLERSLAFYRDLLGFEEVSRISTPESFAKESGISTVAYEVVRLRLPTGERIKLFSPETVLSPSQPSETPLSAPGYSFLTLIVTDLAAAVAEVAAAGYTIARTPQTLRPGVDVALVRDPDGHFVEFVQYDDVNAYLSGHDS
jgi:lactoylglutathione lyase